MSVNDENFMHLALRLARRGHGRTWPNPAVGAVVMRNGAEPQVIARGWTMPGGRPHAEKAALDVAGASAKGATLYVTLEPCCHQGRAGSCTDAIIEAGIARVVCALGDPDPRVAGGGFASLEGAGIELSTGLLESEARAVALGHILKVTKGRPAVCLKLAVGSDGLVPKGEGGPNWVTGEAARAAAHLMRARSDAILLGRGTVMADDPELTCRLPGMNERSPVRVVLDSMLALPVGSKLVKTISIAPLWVFCAMSAPMDREAALRASGVEVFRIDGEGARVDVKTALSLLAARGITRLLVEGGPGVHRSFLDTGVADEIAVFHGERPAGATGMEPFVSTGLDRVVNSGDFILQTGRTIGADRLAIWQRTGLN